MVWLCFVCACVRAALSGCKVEIRLKLDTRNFHFPSWPRVKRARAGPTCWSFWKTAASSIASCARWDPKTKRSSPVSGSCLFFPKSDTVAARRTRAAAGTWSGRVCARAWWLCVYMCVCMCKWKDKIFKAGTQATRKSLYIDYRLQLYLKAVISLAYSLAPVTPHYPPYHTSHAADLTL